MTNKSKSKQVLTTNQIRDYLVNLDKLEKIDLSKVHSSVHFERIIDYIYKESKSPFFTLEELLEPESLEIIIKSRHYNWIRPKGTLQYDRFSFDFRKVTKEDRQKLLDLPIDELRQRISDYLQIFHKLPPLSPKARFDLAECFADDTYCELLWDQPLINSIAKITLGYDD